MKELPLSRVLPDFRTTAVVPVPEKEIAREGAGPESGRQDDAGITERLREAHASGEAAGREAAQMEYERELGEVHARAEERLAEERQRWVSEQADGLATCITNAIEALEARIAEPVARVLAVFLASEMRDLMVRELCESVTRLLSGERDAQLRISGPDDLIDCLRERIGAGHVAVIWEPGDQVDVRLVADDTVIETEIAGWIDRFVEAVR